MSMHEIMHWAKEYHMYISIQINIGNLTLDADKPQN